MKKKLIAILLAALAFLISIIHDVSASAEVLSSGTLTAAESSSEVNYADIFAGRRVGVPTGSIFDQIALTYIPGCVVTYINGYADLALALENGKIDAYVADEPVARLMASLYPEQYTATVLESADYGYIFPKDTEWSAKIRKELSAYIEFLWNDGTLEDLDSIWFGDDEDRKKVEYPAYRSDRDTVRLAVTSEVGDPFVYMKDGVLLGYDIDVIARFCITKGYNLEVTDYSISGMLAAVAGGRSDLAGSTIALTEERSQTFDFSAPNYCGGIVLVTKEKDLNVIGDVSDNALFERLRGNTIGVISGSISGDEAMKKVPDCSILSFNSMTDLVTALDLGKIDAYCADQPLARAFAATHPDQNIYAVVSKSDNAFIYPKDSLKGNLICTQMNGLLEKLREDGTLKAMANLWIDEQDESLKVVDMSGLTGENGTLVFALSSMVGNPNCYIKDGQFVGYDVDLAVRFCREYGYNIEFMDCSFSGMLEAVTSGRADFGGSCISVTEERKESMLFSDAIYNGGTVIVIKGDTPINRTENGFLLTIRKFFEKTAESFRKTLIREKRWKLFLSGIGITLLITVLATVFGSLSGFGLYLLYRKNNRILNGILRAVSDVLGKTPVVVILMVLYYIIFVDSNLSGVAVSVIGFSLLFCFAIITLLDTAESAVPKIQKEVALALGYTENRSYFRVILPQTWRFFLPGFQTEIVALIKGTAVVGYIAVQDLTKVSDIIRSRTYEAFFPLIASAVIYFTIAWLITFLIRYVAAWIEKRRLKRPADLKGVETK